MKWELPLQNDAGLALLRFWWRTGAENSSVDHISIDTRKPAHRLVQLRGGICSPDSFIKHTLQVPLRQG